MRESWKASAIIVAATIGEGMFALPYLFRSAGWLISLAYLVLLAGVVIAAQILYFETLRHVGEQERLLGLARRYLGEAGFWVGFVAIVAGLLLAMVAYLILGPRFLLLAFPGLSARVAFAILWVVVSIPVFVTNRRAAFLEVFGAVLVIAVVLFVFLNGVGGFSISGLPLIHLQGAFVPFGIILLSLAGWTGIEPIYESTRGKITASIIRRGIIFGTIAVAILYILFAIGITGAAGQIVPDTLSGILGWAAWKRFLVAVLGLFAIGVGSIPLTHEIRNALEKDLHWNYFASCLVVVLVPVALIFVGLNGFATVLDFAGGCFIALQYILIISVGRRALSLSFAQKAFLDVVTIIFGVAVIYQIVSFIVR